MADARAWLRGQGHDDVADLIDEVLSRWARQGKRTRRNWWEVLAGDRHGRPRTIEGVTFPVLPAAVMRQREGPPARGKRLAGAAAEAPGVKYGPAGRVAAAGAALREGARAGARDRAAGREPARGGRSQGAGARNGRAAAAPSGGAEAGVTRRASPGRVAAGKAAVPGPRRARRAAAAPPPAVPPPAALPPLPAPAPPAPAPVLAPGRARPFVKWAGGKRQLLGEILSRLPARFGTFHEPFVGGGAVFFALNPRKGVLYDRNERLIRAYRGVRDDVDTVVRLLRAQRNEREHFLEVRRQPVDAGSDAEVAAWLIYLNKAGFNGLYRVNSRNQFNVPFGANGSTGICDEPNLRACAAALRGTELCCEDFSAVADRARKGDLVYFDPPYVPISVTSYFTSYTTHGFDMNDQIRLRDVALALRRRGVTVLLSNSSAPAVRALYQDGFTVIPVSASRMVNSVATRRGRITELLIT